MKKYRIVQQGEHDYIVQEKTFLIWHDWPKRDTYPKHFRGEQEAQEFIDGLYRDYQENLKYPKVIKTFDFEKPKDKFMLNLK